MYALLDKSEQAISPRVRARCPRVRSLALTGESYPGHRAHPGCARGVHKWNRLLSLANPTLDTARACRVPGRMRSGASRVVWYALASSSVARSSPGSGRPASPSASLPPPLRAPLLPQRPSFSQSVVSLCNALQQDRQVRPRQRLPLVLPPAVQAAPVCHSFCFALGTGLTMLGQLDLSLQCKASVSVPHFGRPNGPRSGENKASQTVTTAAVGTRYPLSRPFC